ncbi:MAG: hypothetical protein C0433_14450 [Cyclobacterium sp.]|nr:hypothetical protein [Cyclobacterium sp.]
MNKTILKTESMNEQQNFVSLDSNEELGVNQIIALKEKCIMAVCNALDAYHHPRMKLKEIKTIIRNVIENRVEVSPVEEFDS